MYEANDRAKNMEARTDGTETEIHKYTIIVEDFNTFLSVTVRTTNQKIIKDMEELISTINKQYLINIQRMFHPILGFQVSTIQISKDKKTSMNLKVIEVLQMWFPDHEGIKLEISNRRKTGKSLKTCNLNNNL